MEILERVFSNFVDGSSNGVTAGAPKPLPEPEITITVSSASVTEDDASTITYTFTASTAPVCDDIAINFSASGTTATFNDDYTLVSGSSDFNGTTGTVTIPVGQTSTTLVLQVQSDATFEPNEAITITIQAP